MVKAKNRRKKNCNKNCNQTNICLNENERKILTFIALNNKENGGTIIKELIDSLDITARKTYYNSNNLLRKKLLRNLEKGVKLLVLTKKGEEYVKLMGGDLQFYGVPVSHLRFLDRAHNILICATITHRPSDVTPPGFNSAKNTKKLNWNLPLLTMVDEIRGFSTQIAQNNISFNFSEVYGLNPYHCTHTALNKAVILVNELRKHGFKINKPNYVIVSQHHAIFNKHLAKYSSQFKIHYKSSILEFDKSISPNEFELVNSHCSPDDFLRLTDFFEGIIGKQILLSDLIKLTTLMPKMEKIISKFESEDNCEDL